MLTESHYWMFGNALLLLLGVEAMVILGIHLWTRRREFTFEKHGVSLAVFIYVLGQVLFRTVAWELWREVSMHSFDIVTVAKRLLWLFGTPAIKLSSLFNIVGLIMVVAVLTWEVKYLWVYAATLAVLLALLSTRLA